MSQADNSRFRFLHSELLRVGTVPVLVLVAALFFVFPWLPEPSPAGTGLERYSPQQDGGSFLIENSDADGELVSTESQNRLELMKAD